MRILWWPSSESQTTWSPPTAHSPWQAAEYLLSGQPGQGSFLGPGDSSGQNRPKALALKGDLPGVGEKTDNKHRPGFAVTPTPRG